MNRFIFIGNLTQDTETKKINEKTMCRFTIAVGRNHKAEGQPEADFFNITVWGKVAENCDKYLSKGKKVAVSGRIQNRSYEDKDGNKKYVTDYIADEVEFLSPNNDYVAADKKAESKPSLVPTDEDMPF